MKTKIGNIHALKDLNGRSELPGLDNSMSELNPTNSMNLEFESTLESVGKVKASGTSDAEAA